VARKLDTDLGHERTDLVVEILELDPKLTSFVPSVGVFSSAERKTHPTTAVPGGHHMLELFHPTSSYELGEFSLLRSSILA
jgi:hypothetical protein